MSSKLNLINCSITQPLASKEPLLSKWTLCLYHYTYIGDNILTPLKLSNCATTIKCSHYQRTCCVRHSLLSYDYVVSKRLYQEPLLLVILSSARNKSHQMQRPIIFSYLLFQSKVKTIECVAIRSIS